MTIPKNGVLHKYLLLGMYAAVANNEAAVIGIDTNTLKIIDRTIRHGRGSFLLFFNFLDTRSSKGKAQSGQSIYLAITIFIIRVFKLSIGMAARLGNNVFHFCRGKPRVCLQPKGNDACHNRGGHARTTIHMPWIAATFIFQQVEVPRATPMFGIIETGTS